MADLLPSTILRELRDEEGGRYAANPEYHVLRLHFLEGRSHRSISSSQNIPLHTVKRLLRKTRLYGVHATLSGRGQQDNGTRNRNYGLTRSQEILLKDRIEAGWGSAAETQQWLQEIRHGANPPLTIAAIYGYRRRLASGIRRRKKTGKKPRRLSNCVKILKDRVFARSGVHVDLKDHALGELREMVRSKLGAEKMAAIFQRMGATEVPMPIALEKFVEDADRWCKVLGRHFRNGDTGIRGAIVLLECNKRAPRGGAYLRAGYVVSSSGKPMKNFSQVKLRKHLQSRFSNVYDAYSRWHSSLQEGQKKRRERGLEKLRDKLSNFAVIQTDPIDRRWWLEGTGGWSSSKATAFDQGLKIFSFPFDVCVAIDAALDSPRLMTTGVEIRKTSPRK